MEIMTICCRTMDQSVQLLAEKIDINPFQNKKF